MESVCLCPGHTCPRSTVLRGHLSLSGAAVGLGGHFHALLTGEVTGTKGMPFSQPVTLSTPFYGRQAESELWYVPGASLRLTPWIHSQKLEKILTLQKAWPQYKLGDTPKKRRPLNGTLAFAKSREETQHFFTFSSSWLSEFRLRDPCRMCLFVASLSPVVPTTRLSRLSQTS